MAVEPSGALLFNGMFGFGFPYHCTGANPGLYRLENGVRTLVAPASSIGFPMTIVVDGDGQILVYTTLNAEFRVIRIDPATGNQTVVTAGGLLNGPMGMAPKKR